MRKLMLALVAVAGMAAHGELTWSYTVDSSTKTATLTGVTATDEAELKGALTLPSALDGYKVTTVKASSFQSLAITSLVIPDSVTTIGGGAFANCTALETLDMGNGVTAIGGYSNYSGADTSDYDSYARYGAFGGCLALKSVKFSERLLSIGNQSFAECQALTEVALPDALQTVGVQCFYHAKALTSASLGTKLESIGTYAFAACPELQSVTFRPTETPLLTIGEAAFSGNVKLASVTFSGALKRIESNAFFGCKALAALELPDSLTSIAGGAFANCTALETLDMGNGVTAIGGYSNYSGADTSDYDSYARYGAFGGCLALKSVTFSERLLSIGNQSFAECQSLTEVALPDALQSVGVQCFYHAKALTSASFGTKLESIGSYAFAACPSLARVTFAASGTPLLTIGSYAFSSNPLLASLTLSGSLKTMGSYAFASCPLLRKITIPSVVSTVANNAFAGMENLKEVVFMGLPPENLANAGLATDVRIRYNGDWAEDWEEAVASCGFTNASAYGGGSSGGGEVASGALTLTVTNVVVHYVTQSLSSEAVIPPTTAGIVNVIAEVEAVNAVAIASDWANQYAGFTDKFGTDFSKALTAQTGKFDGAGKPLLVWQDFVAGTDPTDESDVFSASITFDAATGKPVISWSPELSADEAAKRVYRTFGKVRLTDAEWTEINGNEADFNFFKVTVSMK